jgi:hypothetical protein
MQLEVKISCWSVHCPKNLLVGLKQCNMPCSHSREPWSMIKSSCSMDHVSNLVALLDPMAYLWSVRLWQCSMMTMRYKILEFFWFVCCWLSRLINQQLKTFLQFCTVDHTWSMGALHQNLRSSLTSKPWVRVSKPYYVFRLSITKLSMTWFMLFIPLQSPCRPLHLDISSAILWTIPWAGMCENCHDLSFSFSTIWLWPGRTGKLASCVLAGDYCCRILTR